MKTILFLMALALSAACGSTTVVRTVQTNEDAVEDIRRDIASQTVKVSMKIDIVIRNNSGTEIRRKVEGGGSGTVVAESFIQDRSLVMTAWHVCDSYYVGQKFKSIFGFWEIEIENIEHQVLTTDSKHLGVKKVLKVRKHDLCFLETQGAVDGGVAELAKRMPDPYESIMAAGHPDGVYDRNYVYVEDGVFVGRSTEDVTYFVREDDKEPDKFKNFLYFTVPGTGGISGGGVYHDGKLFSVYVAGNPYFAHAGWGPQLIDVKRSLKLALTKLDW